MKHEDRMANSKNDMKYGIIIQSSPKKETRS